MSSRGFTLLETVVALALVGLALAFAGVALPRDRLQAQQAARGLATQLTRARLEAVRRNAFVGVFIDGVSGRYVVFADAGGLTRQFDAADTMIEEVRFGRDELTGVSLSLNTPDNRLNVVFDPRGVASPPGGAGGLGTGTASFSTRRGNLVRQVVVNAQGRGDLR